MKKSTLITTIMLAFMMFFSLHSNAQKFPGLDKSPMDEALYPSDNKIPTKTAKVIYSRPQLKGRTLESLTPIGKVWRTGANEATEITFYKDVNLGNTKIKAATYTLYTIPEKDNYTVIINKDTNVWGSYTYNQENDIARLKVPVIESNEALEALSMVFTKTDTGFDLNIGWGNMRIAVPFTE